MKSLVGVIVDTIKKKKEDGTEMIEKQTKLEEVEGWVEPEKPKSRRQKWRYILLIVVLVQIAIVTFQILSWHDII